MKNKNQGVNVQFNRALGPDLGSKIRFFQDQDWEPILESLLMYTTRTTLLMELTGTDHSTNTFNRITNAISGGGISKPRGLETDATNKNFLRTPMERFEASYLVNLYFGRHAASWRANSLPQTGNYMLECEVLVETYQTFLRVLNNSSVDSAAVSFETFCTVLKGIKAGTVTLHKCKDCNSQYVWPQAAFTPMACPICITLKLDVLAADERFQSDSQTRLVAQL